VSSALEWLAIVVIVAAKFIVPVLIVPFPFAAGWANFVLDTVDGDLLIPLGLEDSTYQPIDKVADWATYVGMAVAARKWRVRKIIWVLFAFRTVGQILFLVTGEEIVFFFFPNFLEPFFLIYATIRHFRKDEVFDVYTRHRWAIWIFVVLYKMQDEWVTHVGNVDRTDLLTRWFR
jgi:hypothetical protein